MKARSAFLLFPHQLFRDTALLQRYDEVYLVEEFLFSGNIPFIR